MQLHIIGNGSALKPQNTNSSFMVVGDKCNMLIDCGYNVYPKLKATDKVNDKLKYIFITHMDDDHIGSLRALMYDLYFNHKTVPRLICSATLEEQLSNYLKPHTSVVKNYVKEPEILFEIIPLHFDYKIGLDLNNEDQFSIKLFKNKHFQPGSGISIFNEVTKNGISITGDTIPCKTIAEEFAYMTSICKNYTMFHDFSNWNAPAMQVHACSDSIIDEYPANMVSRLKYYHNDATVNKKILEF